MPYKIGVTSGLHYVARSEELATTVKKLGFGLTRGTAAVEIALDVPHEVTDTEGKELRNMAKKQGVDVLMHGSLTIPMGIPERSDWRDAQDHIEKSIRSSVKSGAKYVDFHSCLNIWLELMTYTSRKLTMSFCDHEGRFISHILQESEKLRNWFIKERGDMYGGDILNREEQTKLGADIENDTDRDYKDEVQEKLSAAGFSQETIESVFQINRFPEVGVSREEQRDIIARYAKEGMTEREVMEAARPEIERLIGERKAQTQKGREIVDKINLGRSTIRAKTREKVFGDALRKKLENGEDWDSEELRTAQGVLDGYMIMAHYMFYKRDPMWVEMAKFYPRLQSEYGMNYDDDGWLENAWRKAEDNNDRNFKEFFYGAVAAKYLEGHMKKMLQWMEGKDEKNSMLTEKWIAGHKELEENARKLIMGIEMPDARDPQHAGLHLLWSTRQVYVAVKICRQELNKQGFNGNKIWMLADFEHVATQGVDPVVDMEEVVELAPDIGKYCISIHANAPNPSHAHEPLELGDTRVYKLLYHLVNTGFGSHEHPVYVIYERGGGDDPFKRSVETLRLMLRFLDKDRSHDNGLKIPNPVPPDKLPAEFFGYKGAVAGDEQRQFQIIREHTYEPLKDLMEMPDEEFGMLSKTILAKGKRPEQWKKAEFR